MEGNFLEASGKAENVGEGKVLHNFRYSQHLLPKKGTSSSQRIFSKPRFLKLILTRDDVIIFAAFFERSNLGVPLLFNTWFFLCGSSLSRSHKPSTRRL